MISFSKSEVDNLNNLLTEERSPSEFESVDQPPSTNPRTYLFTIKNQNTE